MHIVVKGYINAEGANNRDRKNMSLVFNNNAPFISCIPKINDVLIKSAEDLDVVMPMYNLLKYSKNYSKTSDSLWSYYRDKANNPPIILATVLPLKYNADHITNFSLFKYKILYKLLELL